MEKGFSLVELSIVLVILGLLTGGILTGQSLIRGAELRGVITEFKSYQSAVYTFRDKYFALPGDMTNATRFWGIAGGTGTGAACFSVESTTSATCNGNGNGAIDETAGAGTAVWRYGERIRFWQHLANASLISGNYTGKTDSATNPYELTPGKNVPASRMSNAFWGTNMSNNTTWNAANFWPKTHGFDGELNIILRQNPLIPEEAWSIDTKVDDGKPGTGITTGFPLGSSENAACSTSADQQAAEWDIQNTTAECKINIAIK